MLSGGLSLHQDYITRDEFIDFKENLGERLKSLVGELGEVQSKARAYTHNQYTAVKRERVKQAEEKESYI